MAYSEDKKEFILKDHHFNRIAEISNGNPDLIQLVDGQVMRLSISERALLFWQSICVEYGFDPSTVETNIPMRDARYIKAVPVVLSPERLVNYCRLCNQFSGPDTDSGCDRHTERGCSWYINPNKK